MHGLKSASLQTTIIAENRLGEESFYVPVTLDLMWTGVGKAESTGRSFEKSRLPGFTYMRRSSGDYRDHAVLSGSLWFGSRDILADYDYIYTVLISKQDAETTIIFNSRN